MPDVFCASAPATMMIAGEHAVLNGYAAITGAVNKRMFVELTPRKDQQIIIKSAGFPGYETDIKSLSVKTPFQFVLAVLKQHQAKLISGCTININSEFSHQIGFGSSAAVTVAVIEVLNQWLDLSYSKLELLLVAIDIIKSVQKVGSGSDAAASVFGGVVYFEPNAQTIEQLPLIPDISLIYSGYKTATAEVINLLNEKAQQEPDLYRDCYQQIGQITERIKTAIIDQNWKTLGSYFNDHFDLQKKLGVSTSEIENIINKLRKIQAIFGAKISGSGLGDCVMSFGKLPVGVFPINQFQVELTNNGLAQEMKIQEEMTT